MYRPFINPSNLGCKQPFCWWIFPNISGPEEKAAFFTPKSFADGVVNNGLGVVGFVKEALRRRVGDG